MASLYTTYPPEWPGRPPQMPANDYAVWREFLARRGREWRAYAYDVELHGGDTPIVGDDPGIQRMWARVIAKRADVIAINAAGLTLIEVRRNARYATLGQVQVYLAAFPQDYPNMPLLGGLIACETIDPDVRKIATQIGIAIWTTAD